MSDDTVLVRVFPLHGAVHTAHFDPAIETADGSCAWDRALAYARNAFVDQNVKKIKVIQGFRLWTMTMEEV